MHKNFAENIIRFYQTLKPPEKLPKSIELLYPQKDPAVMQLVKTFYEKYFSDDRPRTILWGINPGRFGAGTTGINFTAPKQLKEYCDIDHGFKNQTELSAEFIYEMIKAYGGVKKFYSKFFIAAVSPLGFVRQGKNVNYYDDKKLCQALEPFIIESINRQLQWPVNRKVCYCIGGEKNFKYFKALNERQGWFEHIIPLTHPRFIMQYRRRQMSRYMEQYVSALRRGGK